MTHLKYSCVLIVLPKFATTCFFSSSVGWCLIRHKNTSPVTLWTAEAAGRKVCLEPIKSLVRSEVQSVKGGPPVWKSHLHSSVCHKAITLTHLLCLAHTHTAAHFLDTHTYCTGGCDGHIKTEVDSVECNLSVT